MDLTGADSGCSDRTAQAAYEETSTAVKCECCQRPLAPGTRAKIDRESGAIICPDCFADLSVQP